MSGNDARIIDVLDGAEVWNFASRLIGVEQRPLATGLPSWDNACDETGGLGLGDWWYVVIGGASNAGKTSLMMHLARLAVESGHTPGVISMEMPTQGIQRRLYSILTGTPYFDFLPHQFDDGKGGEKSQRLRNQVVEYSGDGDRCFYIAEFNGAPRLDYLLGTIEVMQEAGVNVFFVDHLQLVKATPENIADRATEISEALRVYAHTQKVLIVALSQLNRLASRDRSQPPTMHDLLGGTSIESNANQVMLIDHSAVETHEGTLRTWLNLDKNREGPSRSFFPVEITFTTGVWREIDTMTAIAKQWPEASKRYQR